MSPAPISRRALVAGAGAAVAAVAVPAGIVEALAAEMPSMASAAAPPLAFDPQAFCNDPIDAGFRITACRPIRRMLDSEEDLRPGFHITPADGGGFGRRYLAVMRRWTDAMDACPDHVEQVVRYAFGQLDRGTP